MTNPVLSLQNIDKSFGALHVSNHISLDLKLGEIHALIGPNGAGKSTLIQQIAGVLKPDSGRIDFIGQEVTHLPTFERARLGLGRTFQISALAMEYTVLENVLLGMVGHLRKTFHFFQPVRRNKILNEQALEILKRVDLVDDANKYTAEISHGQRRKLEIAVALALQPKAFIMDEPMAGIGVEGSKKLTHFLDTLREEAPILLIEHDMDAVFALADRISVLVYGKIIATGSVEDIRNNAEVRNAYLGEED